MTINKNTPTVFIADKMSELALNTLQNRGINVIEETGLSKAEIIKRAKHVDGVIVRSSTNIDDEIISNLPNLKIIGRAGIGVDNIDITSATKHGVLVMNTPQGNNITTAEHSIALMLSLCRNIPFADRRTRQSYWEKSRFTGMEITGKTLGIIGVGNIGSVVAKKAKALGMNVIAYDPFLTPEQASELGVKKLEWDDFISKPEIISIHVPLNDKTRNIINADAIAKMKKSVRIINCARGGLINEKDLQNALDSGHVAGAALDVFENEPAKDHPLFEYDNVIVTPHLGASTKEAQENVAQLIAEQIADFLLEKTILNSLNHPTLFGENASQVKPYLALSSLLGMLAGQLTRTSLKKIRLEVDGLPIISEEFYDAIENYTLVGLLSPIYNGVNGVNAKIIAKDHDISLKFFTDNNQTFPCIRVWVETERGWRSLAGNIDQFNRPRITEIKGLKMEVIPMPNMIYINHEDRPGIIADLGNILENINVATMQLSRDLDNKKAIAMLGVDRELTPSISNKLLDNPHVLQAVAVSFPEHIIRGDIY